MFFGVFRWNPRKTLRNFAVVIRWCSNLQGSCPFGCRSCDKNKKGNFNQKKITFWAEKRRKNVFFGVFRWNPRKTLGNFAVVIRWCSKLQGSCPFGCRRCAKNKKGNFNQKKITFWAEKRRKNVFFGVFRWNPRKTLRNFAVVIRWCSNLQGSCPFGCRSFAKNKKGNFNQKKNTFWAEKRRKNVFFGVFRWNPRKTLRNFAVVIRWCSNLQGSCPFGCKRCANIKKGNSKQKKITLWAEKRRKNVFFGVFRWNPRKTLRNFAVVIRWCSNLQGSCPFGCRSCAKNKKGNFNKKKNTFWAEKRRKNVFFGVFRWNPRKTLRNFAVVIRWCSNLQGSCPFGCRRCAKNKKGNFNQKKITFCAEKRRKNVFFGVFRLNPRKTLRNFAVVIRWCSNLQGSCPFGCRRCANIKKGNFNQKKITFWAEKRRKNVFFGVFRLNPRKTLRNFAVVIRWCSNLQGSCPFGCRRCAKNKKGNFNQKKITFWAEKRRKNVFFGVFRWNPRKTLRNFAVVIRWCSNLQGSCPFGCRRCAKNKKGNFNQKKNYVLGRKTSKKRVFWCFPVKPQKNAS